MIDVAPQTIDELVEHFVAAGEPLTDLELNIVALTWAHDGASPLDVVAVDEVTGDRLADAPQRQVATTSGLVAMKVTAIPLRASTRPEKRASDLYDLSRLLLAPGPDAATLDADARRAGTGRCGRGCAPGSSTMQDVTGPSARSAGSTSPSSTWTTSRTPSLTWWAPPDEPATTTSPACAGRVSPPSC